MIVEIASGFAAGVCVDVRTCGVCPTDLLLPDPDARASIREYAGLTIYVSCVCVFSSSAQSADTLDKVRAIISEQLGTDLDAVAADAKFVDLGADSLDTVEIMMALEEQFEITLDEEGAEKIATVQDAADMIQAQL